MPAGALFRINDGRDSQKPAESDQLLHVAAIGHGEVLRLNLVENPPHGNFGMECDAWPCGKRNTHLDLLGRCLPLPRYDVHAVSHFILGETRQRHAPQLQLRAMRKGLPTGASMPFDLRQQARGSLEPLQGDLLFQDKRPTAKTQKSGLDKLTG